MKNTEFDVPYCGVNKDKIDTAVPVLNPRTLANMKTFISDRYNIHIKKDVEGAPAPWTTNPILLAGKFTNVRREHDRQTKEYINNISNSDISWFDKFWNTVLFRMFNRIEMFKFIGSIEGNFNISNLGNLNHDIEYRDSVRLAVDSLLEQGVPLFTNAFNTGGLKQATAIPEAEESTYHVQKQFGGLEITLDDGRKVDYRKHREELKSGEMKSQMFEPCMPMRILRYIGFIANGQLKDLHTKALEAKSQLEVYQLIMDNIRGCSRFLSYQIFVDLTYCKEFQFSENEFTVSGPGCDAGLNLLFDDFDGMNKAEAIFWLRDNQHVFGIDFKELYSDLEPHDQCLNVMSLENIFCETSKYMRGVEAIERGDKPRFKVSTAKLVTPPTIEQSKSKVNELW